MSQTSSSKAIAPCTGHRLSPMQAQGALLMAMGRRQREVAKLVGVTHETVCRWRHLPEFESTVSRIQGELIDSTRAKHLALIEEAMTELGNLLKHPSPIIRLRAIQLVFQPLRMPEITLNESRQEPRDERDFEDFMRVFMNEANGGYSKTEAPDRNEIRAVAADEVG
jgi:hypothetical protein